MGLVKEHTRLSTPAKQPQLEAFFQKAWEFASDAMALSDPHAIVLAANPAYLKLYGYSEEEIVGKNFAVIFPENLREWANEEYRKTFEDPTIAPAVQSTIKRKDGTERVVEARYAFVVEGDRRTAMISMVRDVTDQKRAEADAEQRKREFETLAEHSPNIITRHDTQFRYTYVNPAVEEATGIPRSAFAGKTYREVGLGEEFSAFFQKQLDRVIRTHEPLTTEYSDRTPRGVRRYQSRLVPEFDGAGNVVSVLAVSHDITDIRRAEAELRASRETFRSAFEYAPIGIALMGLDGCYLQANPAFCAFTGYSEEELRGLDFQSLARPEDLAADMANLDILRRGQVGSYRMERRYVLKHGEVAWALLSVSLVRDAEGNPLHYIRQVEDITERKRAEASERESRLIAEQAVLDRNRLISIVAHDLRNPLTSIKGRAEMLGRHLNRKDEIDCGRVEGLVGQIERSAVRMNNLIEEMLDYSRLQAGLDLPLNNKPTDLVEVVQRVVEDARRNSPRNQVVVDSSITHLVAEWDPVRLERVFANLLDNAVKYSRPGGEIRVEIESAQEEGPSKGTGPQWVKVRVIDQGIGIPAADLGQIFEWYRRASNADEWASGSGIGLAGARQVVQQYGGSIGVESVPGQSSTFTVSLPVPAGT